MGWCTIDEGELQKLREKVKSLEKEVKELKKEKSLIERPKLHKKAKEHIPTFGTIHNNPYKQS